MIIAQHYRLYKPDRAREPQARHSPVAQMDATELDQWAHMMEELEESDLVNIPCINVERLHTDLREDMAVMETELLDLRNMGTLMAGRKQNAHLVMTARAIPRIIVQRQLLVSRPD